jgi:protein-disulfide isomerase
MELGSSMNKQNIINLLNQLDLEGEKIFNFSETQPYDKTIQLNKKLAKELGLRGTPASIINNTMIPGYIKEQKIIELLDGAKTAS